MTIKEPETYRRRSRVVERPQPEEDETFAAVPGTKGTSRAQPHPQPNRTMRLPLGRKVGVRVPPPEDLAALIAERQQLLQKFDLTPDEQRKLSLLEWKLERIEERELGPALERLEKLADLGQRFANDLNAFSEQLDQRVQKQRTDQPWRRR